MRVREEKFGKTVTLDTLDSDVEMENQKNIAKNAQFFEKNAKHASSSTRQNSKKTAFDNRKLLSLFVCIMSDASKDKAKSKQQYLDDTNTLLQEIDGIMGKKREVVWQFLPENYA